MHILAAHYRSEFLATPQLVRLDYVRGQDGFEPTLLIKASTLLLKYITLGVPMRLAFARLGDRLLYALQVYDDKERAGVIWSILERDEERAAIAALVRGEVCQAFLFNELAVNVAWAALPIFIEPDLTGMIARVAPGRVDYNALRTDASLVIDRLHHESVPTKDLIVAEVPNPVAWNPVFNHYITNQATSSLIDLFCKDEGSHQEQLGLWLTDNLHPLGAHHSPQIPKGGGFRELTDILISYEFGSVLVESKALTILSRDRLPNRKKLAHDVSAHIHKAVSQLRGGMRRLKDGTPITNKAGVQLEIQRTAPMHGIVLIPDLDLIEDREAYGLPFIKEFMKATGGFIHLLDIAELLRVVQAAEMISSRDMIATPMMAFDYYLLERVDRTVEAGTLCVEILLRFTEDK
jgi:hypothetical protein